MASDLGKAYVQIIPKAEGITNKIKGAIDPGASSAGQSAGNNFASSFKKILVGAGLGAAVIGGIKAAIDEGGKLQQSYGGLETLYGDAAEAAKAYAVQAAQAGISANDYAEQAVSFGASLKAAFGGDTAKAAEAANTAILDMADNAAKMGTPLESIQNAYQGFAKQNYTMLDNLKLGYGGTKSEMQRLLSDAEKLTGVKYDMDNLGDVYEAIHVIQQDLGLTGVAADEAATTFTGSMGAMKASAANLLGALSTGQDVGPALQTFVGSAKTFLTNNLLPMIGTVLNQIPPLVTTFINDCAPQLIEEGGQLIASLADGFATKLPEMATKAAEIVREFAAGIGNADIGALLSNAGEIVMQFVNAAIESAKIFLPSLVDAIFAIDWLGIGGQVVDFLLAGMQTIFPQVLDLVGTVVAHIIEKLGFPGLALKVTNLFNTIKSKITVPIEAARNLVQTAVDKIKSIFPISMGKIFSGIKLPHFRIDGGEIPWGIGGMGKRPSVDIEWYAKGGIINSPSVIGVGEAGPEAIVPLAGRNMLPFAKAVADELRGAGGYNQTVNIYSPSYLSPAETARQTRNATRSMLMEMRTT